MKPAPSGSFALGSVGNAGHGVVDFDRSGYAAVLRDHIGALQDTLRRSLFCTAHVLVRSLLGSIILLLLFADEGSPEVCVAVRFRHIKALHLIQIMEPSKAPIRSTLGVWSYCASSSRRLVAPPRQALFVSRTL